MIIAVWLIGTMVMACFSLVGWSICKLMDVNENVQYARAFFLSPLWPLMVIGLLVLVLRDALGKD